MRPFADFFSFALLASAALLSGCGGGADSNLGGAQNTLAATLTSSAETPRTLPTNAPARFAYISNYDTADISTFEVDALTGDLRWVGNTPAGSGPGAVVMHPSGDYAFVANFDSNDVSTFRINRANGLLQPVQRTPAGIWPAALVLTPSGNFAYTANFASNTVSMFRVDMHSGSLLPLGDIPTGINPRQLLIEPSGRFMYVANWGSQDISVFTIDTTSGLLQASGPPLRAPDTPFNLQIAPSGIHLYLLSFLAGSNNVHHAHIQPDNGQLTLLPAAVSAGAHPIAMAMNDNGRFAYVANSLDGSGGNSISAFSVAPDSGLLTQVDCGCGQNGYATGINPNNLAFSPTGTHLYVTNASSNDVTIYAVDRNSGILTLSGHVTTVGSYPMGITFGRS